MPNRPRQPELAVAAVGKAPCDFAGAVRTDPGSFQGTDGLVAQLDAYNCFVMRGPLPRR